MEPMSSPDFPGLCSAHREMLLKLARASVEHGLDCGQALPLSPGDYPPELGALRATFVTLRVEETLCGCIGSSRPSRTLVEDVASNAYGAAFLDPRFPALKREELAHLHIHISILSPFQELRFTCEEDLLAQMRPGVDGFMLEEDLYRGVLLPAVWASLTTSGIFLRHLKLKAGLPQDYWSKTLKVWRCTAESIP